MHPQVVKEKYARLALHVRSHLLEEHAEGGTVYAVVHDVQRHYGAVRVDGGSYSDRLEGKFFPRDRDRFILLPEPNFRLDLGRREHGLIHKENQGFRSHCLQHGLEDLCPACRLFLEL